MRRFAEEKPSLDELAHYGVKGMKWGVRKANPTTSEIQGARQRQAIRWQKVIEADQKLQIASSSSQKKSAERQIDKAARDFATNEDRVTAARMTRGEKATALILAGPVGLIVIGANKSNVKRTAKATDQARQVK